MYRRDGQTKSLTQRRQSGETILQVRGVSPPWPLELCIIMATTENDTAPLPAQSTWIWSSGGKAVHYSWGFSYSLDVPERNLVLLVWAAAMNIYKSCSIFKHASEYIASSKCQVNSTGVVFESQGGLSFCCSFFAWPLFQMKLMSLGCIFCQTIKVAKWQRELAVSKRDINICQTSQKSSITAEFK